MPLYAKIDHVNLMEGQTYKVKHRGRDLGNLIFSNYVSENRILGTIPMSTIRIYISTEDHTFYKAISEEEYQAKLRTRFDTLDNFKW